jgi:hypothetical protein
MLHPAHAKMTFMDELRRKPGTRPKGARSAITCRVPVDHREVIEEAAAKEGLGISDFVALVLARNLGLPDPEFIQRSRSQEELPLSKAS